MSYWTETDDEIIKSRLALVPFPYDIVVRLTGRTKEAVKARTNRLRELAREDGSYPTKQVQRRINGVVFHKNKLMATEYAGMRKCLNCKKTFESWHVRKNQLCARCGDKSEDDVVYHSMIRKLT